MAADVYSENIMDFISPRLSFSNDLENDKTTNDNQINDDNFHSVSDSTFDFAFVLDTTASFQSSTADELFCNGNIIPISLKKEEDKEENEEEEEIKPEPIEIIPNLKSCLDQSSPKSTPEEKKKSLKEFLEDSIEEDEYEPSTASKPLWKFRRSNSLNCDRNRRKGLADSWKILSRSGSTGKFLEKILEEDESIGRKSFWKFSRNNSVNSQPAANINCRVMNGSSKMLRRNDSTHDQCRNVDNITKVKPFRRSSSLNCETRKGINQCSVSSTDKVLPRTYSSGSAPKKHQEFMQIRANAGQKRQVKSNFKGYSYGNYNGNVKVSSVLNLPSPYISRVSVDLFGFCMFCNGIVKDKKKRK